MTKRDTMGEAILKFEGRFDRAGNLMVYRLPSGDGGGKFEVAGINERYHRAKANELKRLIERKQHGAAKKAAAEYIIAYTDGVLEWFEGQADEHPHIEFLLRDSAFNRGLRGAAATLQIALPVSAIDGVIGPISRRTFHESLALDSLGLAERITKARETYERNRYPWKKTSRDEKSPFWRGLANRWANAHQVSQELIA